MIATRTGTARISNLRVGDKVLTRDNGYMTIRWIAEFEVDLRNSPEMAPYDYDGLLLSPAHRVLVNPHDVSSVHLMHLDEREMLAEVKHVWKKAKPQPAVFSYYHFMLDSHQLVLATGPGVDDTWTWAETFFPGRWAVEGIPKAERAHMFDAFPALRSGLSNYGKSCRIEMSKFEAGIYADALRVQKVGAE